MNTSPVSRYEIPCRWGKRLFLNPVFSGRRGVWSFQTQTQWPKCPWPRHWGWCGFPGKYKVNKLKSLGFPRIIQSVSTFKILLYILLLRGNCAKFLRRTSTRCDERSLWNELDQDHLCSTTNDHVKNIVMHAWLKLIYIQSHANCPREMCIWMWIFASYRV